jgi:hypothetical protein
MESYNGTDGYTMEQWIGLLSSMVVFRLIHFHNMQAWSRDMCKNLIPSKVSRPSNRPPKFNKTKGEKIVIRIHSKISNPLMRVLPIISCIVMA